MNAPAPDAARMSDVRVRYLMTAKVAVAVVARPEVGERWDAPSVLDRMTVGEVAAHLVRGLVHVADVLLLPPRRGATPLPAGVLYGSLEGTTDLDGMLNTAVRERAGQVAATGHAAVVEDARATLDLVFEDLPGLAPDRRVTAFASHVMTLDEFLRTRLVELCLHVEDLRLSVGLGPDDDRPDDLLDLPRDALAEAVAVLVEAALHRHGHAAVLRALGRRERDVVEALRVL